jgi:hypothetical protein
MNGRRSFLKTTALAALAAAGPPVLGAAAAPAPGAPLLIRRIGDVFVVNGWILTARDLEALRLHDS